MKRTYLDTNVLFAAARGVDASHEAAMAIIEDPERTFVSGVFSMLEVVPVPLYNGKHDEVEFYDTFYQACEQIIEASAGLCQDGLEEAKTHGMGGMDALHVVSAERAGADELVTGEQRERAIHRATRVRILRVEDA